MSAVTEERVWLFREIDGKLRHWECPAAAVDGWIELGWALADGPPPEEPNRAVAHLLAAQAEAVAAQAEQAAPETEAPVAEASARTRTKPTKSADGGAEIQE